MLMSQRGENKGISDLKRRLQFLTSIVEQDPNPILRILLTGQVIFANPQGEALIKLWHKEHNGLPKQVLQAAQLAQSNGQSVSIEMKVTNKFFLLTLIWLDEFEQINVYGTDISQLKKTDQDMVNLAHFDALTQIHNRQYFEKKLKEEIHQHFVDNESLALLLIDLDNFKIINDTLGHPIGDLALKTASKRMVRCIRQSDFIARLGGDEFIVLLHNSSIQSAIMVAEKINSVLARVFHFGEYAMKITASIGIALFPESGSVPTDLLKHADIAMYQAKKAGKNNYVVFSKILHSNQDKRNEIIRKELKSAVAKNELYIEYQPQIHTTTHQIFGFEALIRWLHPKIGLVLPKEFIPNAEQTGCIHTLSHWLLKQALVDYSSILSPHFNPPLSINISLIQLGDSRFIDILHNYLIENSINKDKVILDIPEPSLADHYQQIVKSLRKIHLKGYKICLDNFGSPQVSLPKLLALPLDYIKLDQLLLAGIEKNQRHRILLQGIIRLAHDLKIEVIQKGIENEQQHQIVTGLGCSYVQGYYYCKPIKINELSQFIKSTYSP
jgi:diguanylate cyclase (GGDEF)-like protein